MPVKIISVFNNKGGVGKTTLTFHLAHALAESGKKVLAVDLDPQCNLSIYSLSVEQIQSIWEEEDDFVNDPGFQGAMDAMSPAEFADFCNEPRTIHFSLKPAEEGIGELEHLSPPLELAPNLHLIPGRLTLHMFEEALARRWSEAFVGQPLALRTMSEVRRLILKYADAYGYDYAIVDTSPSLGQLNKNLLTTLDAFLIPCAPDLFSLYGIRNIGSSLTRWLSELKSLYHLIPPSRRPYMPVNFVGFLGYTIYNAKKREGSSKWNMAIAHFDYASKVPSTISDYMPADLSKGLPKNVMKEPIGGMSVMHSHNTYPTHAQKYHTPIWNLPLLPNLEESDKATVLTNRERYLATRQGYLSFANDVIGRLDQLKPERVV